MKTTLLLSQKLFGAIASIGKLNLVVFAVSICLCAGSSAGAKPVYKNANVHAGKPGNYKTGRGIIKAKDNLPVAGINKPAAIALPTISYSSPQNYIKGTAITSLAPVSSGVAAVGYGSPVTLGSGFVNGPYKLALDQAGNVYMTDRLSAYIIKLPVGGGSQVNIGSGFVAPGGIAVDAAGNVYVCDGHFNSVIKIPAGGGSQVTIASGFNHPQGIALDAAGNVYVADTDNNIVEKIPVGGGAPVTVASGFNEPNDAAVDAAGYLYVSDQLNNAIWKIAGGTKVSIGSGFSNPAAVAVDASGNVYVADASHSAVKEIRASGGSPVTLGSGFSLTDGIAVDGAGNVFVSDYNNDAVKGIKPVGGYYISPALPAGLSFDNATGIISGAPTAASPATNYTVTAWNSSGSTSAMLSVAVNLPPPLPTISYSSPQTYTVGNAIAVLMPAGSGVAYIGYGNPAGAGSGFSSPRGAATDAAGNVYVADYGNNAIKKIPAGGGGTTTVGSGFSGPTGVAVDAAGNIYVSDYGNHAIKEIPVGGGAIITLSSGLTSPYGVAVDGSNNVYYADFTDNAIKKIPVGGGAAVAYSSGFNNPFGVAADAAGNVYVADYGNNAIKKIPVGGGAPVFLGSFTQPYGVAVDAVGNVYVPDAINHNIKEIRVKGGPPVTLGSGFTTPAGITVDAAGDLYVADYGSSAVLEMKPVGGYYLSAALPAGLSFDNVTGIISGVPAAATPATNYTITGWNSTGSSSAAVNITVNLPPPPPNVSYTGPQTYTAGTAIPTLTPANSGVAAFAYSGGAIMLASGINNPEGIAVDLAGNLYVTELGADDVLKIPPGGGEPVIIGSGFSQPSGVAVDAAGNVYVADFGNSAVKEIPVGGGDPVILGSGFSQPRGIAVDAAGNVYVTDVSDGWVQKIPAGNAAPPVIVATSFNTPYGITVDAAGNIYVADFFGDVVQKIPASGGPIISIGAGFHHPASVAVDASGNVYVADEDNNSVKLIRTGSNTPVIIGSGFSQPAGVAADGAGNVYVTDVDNSAVKEIKPVGGYFISPALPAGLSFNNTNGTITGTPTMPSPATAYTISAYNTGGRTPASLNITVNLPAAPVISYTSPHIYLTAAAITKLFPSATGVAAPGYSNMPLTLASGFNVPAAVAVDNAGNVYEADSNGSLVRKIPVGGGAPVTLGSGFLHPSGIAVDAQGNVFVADAGNIAVKEIPVGGGAPFIIGSGFGQPVSVAVDAQGNVYVIDAYYNTLKMIPAGNGAPVTLASGFLSPVAVTLDAAGNIYVADTGDNTIKKVPAGGGTPAIIAFGFHGPMGVAIDASGNLFVGDQSSNSVKMVPAGGGATVIIGAGFLSPAGVAVDGQGNVYVGDSGNSAIKKIQPVGGYYINKALPAGLVLNSTNGSIGGTPPVLSPATNYTVTAYNRGGSSQAIVNIKIAANPNLANLAISSGTLSPAFAATTTGYTASVGNAVSSITLTPTTADAAATVTVNGTTVASGSASASKPLLVGQNVITTVVTGRDGATKKTYTVTVTRAPSSNAYLVNLTVNGAALSPAFSPLTTSYTAQVTNITTSVTITPVVADNTATVKVNGTAVSSGTASASIPLNVGPNTITTVVTAQDGTTTDTYAVMVTRAASANANLQNLVINSGTLSPAFHYTTTSYTAAVPNAITSIKVTPTVSDVNATIKVNGTTVASKTASAAIALNAGPNIITTVVTAQNGTTTQTYTLTVTRAPSTDATLASLKINSGTLSPAFAAATTSYTASEKNGITSITLTPATSDAGATVKVNGAAVSSGTPSASLPLAVGPNTITTVVTAQDGITTKTYSITVTRAPSGNTNLANLTISTGTLAPAFHYTTTSYTASVGNAVTSIKVTPVLGDLTASVKINGTTVNSGTASPAIPLNVGPNTISTVVTAQDGVSTQTYTLTVTRATGPVNIPDQSVSVAKPIGSSQLENDGIAVRQGISPNGDGVNDFLVIEGISNYPDNKLMIMNRSGVLVFEAKGYDNSTKIFDGHSNKTGAMQLPGTYFYSLDYNVNGVPRRKTGFIVLKY